MHRIPLLATLALSAAMLVVPGLASGSVAGAAGSPWGQETQVPPVEGVHTLPQTVAFPDGTLMAVWTYDDVRLEDPPGTVLRSTRPPGGVWNEPITFGVPDVGRVNAIAPRADGGLEISYRDASRDRRAQQVRTWRADGSLGKVTLSSSEAFSLSADPEGDIVATRLGRDDQRLGVYRVVRYLSGEGDWQAVPSIGADHGDVFVTGPGDSVWMAGYDRAGTRLVVRRWTPTSAGWTVDWSRDYPSGHRGKPLVLGQDLAVTASGRAVLAFREREIESTGETIRAVRRRAGSGWARPAVLQRLAAHEHLTASTPAVAAAGTAAEVAWTSSGAQRGTRDIRIARLGTGGPDVRRLAVAGSFRGFRDMSLDVDLRDDGDLLVTYLQRRGSRRQLVGWLGTQDELDSTTLLRDASVMLGDSAFLVPGLTGVVWSVRGGLLVSRTAEE